MLTVIQVAAAMSGSSQARKPDDTDVDKAHAGETQSDIGKQGYVKERKDEDGNADASNIEVEQTDGRPVVENCYSKSEGGEWTEEVIADTIIDVKCVDGNLVPTIIVSGIDDVDGCKLETDANDNSIAENQDNIAPVRVEIIGETFDKQSSTHTLTALSGADDPISIASTYDKDYNTEEKVATGQPDYKSIRDELHKDSEYNSDVSETVDDDSPDVSETVYDDSPDVSETVDDDKSNESVGELENSLEERKEEVIASDVCPTRENCIYYDIKDVSGESIEINNRNDDQVNGHACLNNESSDENTISSQFIDREDDIERVLEIKEAFKACLKSKRQLRESPRGRIERVLIGDDNSEYDDEEDLIKEHIKKYTPFVEATHDTIEPNLKHVELEDINSIEANKETLINKTEIGFSSADPTPTMPETRDVMDTREGDGCVSPTLGFASCRYRWEKTIYTQEDKVCFVTLNNRNIEPIRLNWSDSAKCYMSDEVNVPVGAYVGNLIIDGTFYPVEDVTIKHYTFEVDLYLKDDILEDETKNSGVAKAEQFLRGQQRPSSPQHSTYPQTRATNSHPTYPQARARMDMAAGEPDVELENSLHLSNKYEDLVRSQINLTDGTMSGNESDTESKGRRSDFPDVDGRGTPVGADSAKLYQDGDDTALKTLDMGHIDNEYKNLILDDYLEKLSAHSSDSRRRSDASRDGKMSPAVVDDVLGNGHSRTPIYSTESPVHSKHSSAHSSSRHTPMDNYVRPESSGSLHSKHSSARLTPTNVDDIVRALSAQSQHSFHSSARQTPTNVREPSLHDSPAVSSVHSANSVSHHVLEDLIGDALGPESSKEGSQANSISGRPDSVSSHYSNDSNRQILDDLIKDAFNYDSRKPLSASREGSMNGSRPRTPTPQEQISDVLNPSDRHSPIRREYLNSSPYNSHPASTHSFKEGSPQGPGQGSKPGSTHGSQQGSTHGSQPGSRPDSRADSLSSSRSGSQQGFVPGTGTNSAHSSQRVTPHRDLISSALRASQEKLYLETDVRKLVESDYGGSNASNQGSRPQSLTSEQELSQYYDGSQVNRAGSSQKIGSASSLPVIGTSPGVLGVKRSQTPDGHVRVPAGPVGPIMKGRTPPRTPLSNASSRTVTPVNMETETERNLREQIRDLDGVILNQRKMLLTQEDELSEVRKQLASAQADVKRLQTDLDLVTSRPSPGPQIAEIKRQVSDLTDERNQLQRELTQLKDELRRKNEPGLNSYNPNSPSALQRRIDELKGQVQDLQEANEAAVSDMQAAERRVKELAADNERLRVTRGDRAQELEAENRTLKTELTRLKEHAASYNEASDYRTKIELQQVKEDNRNLRERNYQLHDDNIRLREELSNLRKSLELVDSSRKVYRDDARRSTRVTENFDRKEVPEQESSNYHSNRKTEPLVERRVNTSYPGTRQVYTSKSLYETRVDSLQELPANTDRFLKTDSFRDDSFRSGPEGGSDDKYSGTQSYGSALGHEKTSLLSSAKDFTRSRDFSDLDLGKHQRTTSAELDYRSLPLPLYKSDFSKTTPALFGRSRGERSVLDREDNYRRKDNSRIGHSHELRQKVLSAPPLYADDGNSSDTPTDILVNVKPIDKIPSSSWSRRQRRGSAGSDGSDSSFSDIDEQIQSAARKRSKSADSRELLRRMGPTGGPDAPGEKTLSRTLSPAPSGLRSITPRPLATQHNKGALSLSTSLNSLTQGLRPFAPRSAQDLQINDVIKFSRQGGKLSQGTIKFIGHLPGRGDIYLGVELDKEDGKHDGIFEAIRYFQCKPNKGVFVAYNKVVMAWTGY
ncbi:uncharacterized protein LOC127854035 isoform X3 [Dreissena polymorpha]|uniref:uncharacterized protein LOC127854035 isoform X3 n=1 Tax=Dreissena polymorpha TaxID=45954 RepID=UPI002263BB00|nr:uncharacterized protein LOC127854035 isoform X3 [Dreissena polymorpha]